MLSLNIYDNLLNVYHSSPKYYAADLLRKT